MMKSAPIIVDEPVKNQCSESLELSDMVISALHLDLNPFNTDRILARKKVEFIWNQMALKEHETRIRSQVTG